MTRLVIDNTEVEVPDGSTILHAARRLGLDIPALCFREGCEPATSCMVCLVKVAGRDRLVPSCATPVEEGMRVESETAEVRRLRRTGLELLLSDHVGDCTAPCQSTCPTHMDIPLMLRQVAAGRLDDAIATIKRDIALPAVLGRVCPDLCERTCRRRDVDHPASICLIKRFVADVDLASDGPYTPPCRPGTGKTVAIVGAGATGLSAAYHLLAAGHACTLFDGHERPGGALRYGGDAAQFEDSLPQSVLDGEIAVIEKMGAVFRLGVEIGGESALADLRSAFDAVLITIGAPGTVQDSRLGPNDRPRFGAATEPRASAHAAAEGRAIDRLPRLSHVLAHPGLVCSEGHIKIDPRTYQTSLAGVFAAGRAIRPGNLVVRSVADGKYAALCIDQYLSGAEVVGSSRAFTCRVERLSDEELGELTVGAGRNDRVTPARGATAGFTEEEARAEALRCLHCDCGARDGCKLRYYAQLYGAEARSYRGERRPLERRMQHADIVYEPGKCILCGLCVQIASEACEPLGLAFIGRGFDVRVDVPFDRSIVEGLKVAARRCAEVCPTGALVLREEYCSQTGACNARPSGAC